MSLNLDNLEADERLVFLYLQNWPGEYISATEITRRADGKNRCQQDPRWATTALAQLVAAKWLETDGHGKYRVAARNEAVKLGGKKRFVAPHLRAILERHGGKFPV